MLYNNIELNCTQEELNLFINTIQVESKICDFAEKYNNVTIENPTGIENAKYYILKINGITILQAHDPRQQGYVAITNANAQGIIDTQKQDIIDSMIFEKFKVKEKTEIELLQQQVKDLNLAIASMMGV